MSAPTVRRFPRSMAEAFPRDHACAIERPRPSVTSKIADAALATAIGIAGALFLVHWWSS